MSSRRAQSQLPTAYEKQMQLQQIEPPPPGRSKCMSCLCFSWKVFTCIFSHATLITMVVAYCVLGAFTFERLEAENEREVSNLIYQILLNALTSRFGSIVGWLFVDCYYNHFNYIVIKNDKTPISGL